ncbi:MAG: 2-hydroxymuconate tautomerase family protein [Proteobacteria bacterium]|nr:2-hydroxymuconate tautomerase family protein [Pseudomonadota bacterium]
MPIVQISLLEGRDDKAKTRLVKRVTAAVAESLRADPKSVRVLLYEMPPANFAAGGRQKSESKN